MADSYSIRFSIVGPERGVALVAAATEVAKRWAEDRHYPANKQNSGDSDELLVQEGEFDEAAYGRVVLEHSDRAGRPVRWRTEVTVATLDATAEVRVDARVIATDPLIQPDAVAIDRPTIVSALLNRFTADYAGHPLSDKPFWVTRANAEAFTRDVILSPLRRLPVVVVARTSTGGHPVNVSRMADRLAGLATVAVYDNEAAPELARQLGERFGCYDGAVRTYWPGFDQTDSPFRHRLWLADRSSLVGERLDFFLLDQFLPKFARHAAIPGVFQRALGRIEKARLDERVAQRTTDNTEEFWEEIVSEYKTDLERLQQELEASTSENEELQILVEDLEAANASLLQALMHSRDGASTPTDDIDLPETVLEAVGLAVDRFPRSLRFLRSAYTSAEESPFRDAPSVFHSFELLDEIAALKRERAVGQADKDWFAARGISFRPSISPTTRGRWGDQYTFRDGEVSRLMEPHLAFGSDGDPANCLRIHLVWDDDESRWIIGHVGRHLRNTMS